VPHSVWGALCLSKNKFGCANILFFSFNALSGNIAPILVSVLLQKFQTPLGIHKIGYHHGNYRSEATKKCEDQMDFYV
jgi:hypothetical protein